MSRLLPISIILSLMCLTNANAQNTESLIVTISAEGDSVNFTIKNTSDKKAKVCTYHTPFEGFNADYFEVKKGLRTNKYTGIMRKRKAPGKDDYITILPGESKSTTISLKDGYEITKGTYSVKFKGSKYVNELPDSNKITTKIK